MRKHQDPASNTDQLERTQRDQEERSKQALSNQGSQDRKPTQANPDSHPGPDRYRAKREPQPR